MESNWNVNKISDIRGDFEQIGMDDLSDYPSGEFEKSVMKTSYEVISAFSQMKNQAPTEGYNHFFGKESQETLDNFKRALEPILIATISEGKIDGQFLPSLMSLGLTQSGDRGYPVRKEKNPIGGNGDLYQSISKSMESAQSESGSFSVPIEEFKNFYKKHYQVDLKLGDYDTFDIYHDPCQVRVSLDHIQVNRNAEEFKSMYALPAIISIGEVSPYYNHAIATVDLITVKGWEGTDMMWSEHARRQVLVKKTRNEEGEVQIVPLYISRDNYTIEQAQEIMGYDFKPIYTSEVDFDALATKDPGEWKDSLKEQLELAGYQSGALVYEDQLRIKKFLYETQGAGSQLVKKRSFVLDGKSIEEMTSQREIPDEFLAYLQEVGVEFAPNDYKNTLYLDLSKSRGDGLEFYVENMNRDKFPSYLVLKKGDLFTWVLPKESLSNDGYYYINLDKDQIQIEVSMDGKKLETIPLSYLFLDGEITSISNGDRTIRREEGMENVGAFVPIWTGIYTTSDQKMETANSGYEVLMKQNSGALLSEENALNRMGLAQIISYTPVSPPIVYSGEIVDAPEEGRGRVYLENLVSQGIYSLDNGAIYPNATVTVDQMNPLTQMIRINFPQLTPPSFDNFGSNGTYISFLQDFGPIAMASVVNATINPGDNTQTDFLNSLTPDDQVLRKHHELLGIKGFSLMDDLTQFPYLLLPLFILLALGYFILAKYGKLPENYNLLLPETREGMFKKRKLKKDAEKSEKEINRDERSDVNTEVSRDFEEMSDDISTDTYQDLDETKDLGEDHSADMAANSPLHEAVDSEQDSKSEDESDSSKAIFDSLERKRDKFCSQCGQEREEGAKFCGKCGNKFD